MKSVLVLLLSLTLILLDVSANKYCDSSLCPLGKRHILCDQENNHYNDWETSNFIDQFRCGTQYRIGNLQRIKEIALQQINNIRNQVAAGYHPLLPQASRMPTVVWDDELASLAGTIVIRCPYGKANICLNTPTYRNVSWLFNNNYGHYQGNNVDFKLFFKAALNQWRSTEKFMTKADVLKPTDLFLKNSDFTIFINQKANRVGCAVSVDYGSSSYVTCLFSTSNIVGVPVYDAGRAASKCTTGKNPCYTALCSEKEVV